LTKKDAKKKTRDFLGFSSFFACFHLLLKFGFCENKKMPNGIFEQGSRSEPLLCLFRGDICDFSSKVSPFFYY